MSDFNGRARSILAPKESIRPQARPEQAQNALTPTESIRPQARPEQTQGSQTVVDKEREDLFTLFTQMLTEYRNLSTNPTVQPVSENPDRQFYQSTLSEMDRFGGVSQATDAQTAVPAPPPVATQEINLPAVEAPAVGAPVVEAPVVEAPTPANSSPVSVEVFEAVIEDQLDQDIPVSEMDTLIEPPQFLGEGERISESTRSGQVSGIAKNYRLNGVERSIIDVSETTESDPSFNYPAEPSAPPVNVQNVVLHYTGGLYTNGVRHYMNSFSKAASAAYFVDRSGKIYETFDPTVKGYHVSGSAQRNPRGIITNSNSIGVEVEATDADLPTQAQLEATAWLSDYLIAQYGAQRVVAHPQANIHKGHVEGYDLVNYWRSQKGLTELTPSTTTLENLFSSAPSTSLRPKARPEN